MAEELKFCVSCKYHTIIGRNHLCQRSFTTSLVTGRTEYTGESCEFLRSSKARETLRPLFACGPEGVFWERNSNWSR